VANAVPEVKAIAHLVTKAAGGEGAVREFCEFVLRAKGALDVPSARPGARE
jgi:3-deoxy-D-manno-octulosonate 8-phosphate phosphatase (KDO 8-P phosphatase)